MTKPEIGYTTAFHTGIKKFSQDDAISKTAAIKMAYKNMMDLRTDTMDSQVVVDKGFYPALPEKKETN